MEPTTKPKNWLTSKTLILNVITFLIGAIPLLAAQQWVIDNPRFGLYLVEANAILNFILRWFSVKPITTETPTTIEKKENKGIYTDTTKGG